MTTLESVKKLLGNVDNDELLEVIIDLTEKRLKNLIGEDLVPVALEYVVTEVSVARYNRISSEGLSSHSIEGETLSFKDDDFDSYLKDIKAYLESNAESKRGKLRFL